MFDGVFDLFAETLNFFYEIVPNYAIAIALLTLLVMLLTTPFTLKGTRSMIQMQRLQPEMRKLQLKYKDDRQKLNEELMAFYKENEINPFASCLPLVAQLPIFIALYYVLRDFAEDASVEGGSVSFMWLISDVRVDLQDIGWGAIVLVAIYGLSQLLSTELSECGLACLAMVGVYHGHEIDLNSLRQKFSISILGSSLRGLMKLADHLGLSSRALRVSFRASRRASKRSCGISSTTSEYICTKRR